MGWYMSHTKIIRAAAIALLLAAATASAATPQLPRSELFTFHSDAFVGYQAAMDGVAQAWEAPGG